jgi:hypothetical protein
MSDDVLMRKGTAILQSCTVSLEVVPCSCSEMCITSSDNVHEVISIKVEEIPEPISFSAIKAEPEEVSYLSVCPLLDTCHRCQLMPCVSHDLHLYICSVKQLHYVEWKFQSLLDLCESLVRQFACK